MKLLNSPASIARAVEMERTGRDGDPTALFALLRHMETPRRLMEGAVKAARAYAAMSSYATVERRWKDTASMIEAELDDNGDAYAC